MYEDNEQPVLRRLLWIILWFIIIGTIAWAVIWLAFFRHTNSDNPGGLQQGNTSQSTNPPNNKNQGSKSTGSSTQSGSSTAPSPTSTSSSSGTASTSTPSQTPPALANAGAGDVFVPFAVATMAGSSLYYLRLRKRLEQ